MEQRCSHRFLGGMQTNPGKAKVSAKTCWARHARQDVLATGAAGRRTAHSIFPSVYTPADHKFCLLLTQFIAAVQSRSCMYMSRLSPASCQVWRFVCLCLAAYICLPHVLACHRGPPCASKVPGAPGRYRRKASSVTTCKHGQFGLPSSHQLTGG